MNAPMDPPVSWRIDIADERGTQALADLVATFVGAEIARQRDEVAGADQQGEIGHQIRRRGLVRQRQRECDGSGHSAA